MLVGMYIGSNINFNNVWQVPDWLMILIICGMFVMMVWLAIWLSLDDRKSKTNNQDNNSKG